MQAPSLKWLEVTLYFECPNSLLSIFQQTAEASYLSHLRDGFSKQQYVLQDKDDEMVLEFETLPFMGKRRNKNFTLANRSEKNMYTRIRLSKLDEPKVYLAFLQVQVAGQLDNCLYIIEGMNTGTTKIRYTGPIEEFMKGLLPKGLECPSEEFITIADSLGLQERQATTLSKYRRFLEANKGYVNHHYTIHVYEKKVEDLEYNLWYGNKPEMKDSFEKQIANLEQAISQLKKKDPEVPIDKF